MTNDFQTVFTGHQTRRVKYQSVPDNRWLRPKKFFCNIFTSYLFLTKSMLTNNWNNKHMTSSFIDHDRRTDGWNSHSGKERKKMKWYHRTQESDASTMKTKNIHVCASIILFAVQHINMPISTNSVTRE